MNSFVTQELTTFRNEVIKWMSEKYPDFSNTVFNALVEIRKLNFDTQHLVKHCESNVDKEFKKLAKDYLQELEQFLQQKHPFFEELRKKEELLNKNLKDLEIQENKLKKEIPALCERLDKENKKIEKALEFIESQKTKFLSLSSFLDDFFMVKEEIKNLKRSVHTFTSFFGSLGKVEEENIDLSTLIKDTALFATSKRFLYSQNVFTLADLYNYDENNPSFSRQTASVKKNILTLKMKKK